MISVLRAAKRRLVGVRVPPIPVRARHAEYSVIMSADDEPAQPSGSLLDLALRASQRARQADMSSVVSRMSKPPFYPDVWPGEHYKLLASLVAEIDPAVVIEIGTATGLSALAMLTALGEAGCIHTFDVLPWNRFPETCLTAADFATPRLKQVVGDVGDYREMERHANLFRGADLIFLDGPKDGSFEARFLANLERLGRAKATLLVFDDIRVWNMLRIWRDIRMPKLDVTSFGHWSGTGLVEWQ
jgi:predicted O-methyltransferase YrrM